MADKNKDSLKAKYDHIKDANIERSFFYKLLSGLFLTDPDKSLLELLGDEDVNIAIRRKGEVYAESLELVTKFIDDCNKSGVDAAVKVSEDYNATFCFGKDQVYPYESTYLSSRKVLFQSETIAVRNWYFEYDLAPKMLFSDPDDHIGLELQFMMNLTDRLVKALEKKDVRQAKDLIEAQAKFLKEHPLKWFNKFADQVEIKARTDFYRGFARILTEYVKDDLENLKDQYLVLESVGRLETVSEQGVVEKVEIQ